MMPARSCNDPEHEAQRARNAELLADAEYGTPCLACGAPIKDGIGHDFACRVWTPVVCGNCQQNGSGPCYERAAAAGMDPV